MSDEGSHEHAKVELSKVELAKLGSNALRGSIASTLVDAAVPSFSDDDKQLLKFHGVYQQDDREKRHAAGGAGKSYSMMIRVRIPGGALTPDQYLALDEIAGRYANDNMRITTRQGIQYHGVLKGDLKSTIADINHSLLSTLSACGDVQRNVMASPAPFADDAHREVQALAHRLALELAPATGAYHEIWLDGEPALETGEEEPFYGKQYLPRKFKTGVALDTDNSIDLYTYDCGLVAITKDGTIRGYNLLVGGGLGMTHNKPDTIARIASVIGFLKPEHAIDAVRGVAAVFRDHGERSDRRHSRLKYLIEDWGVEKFVEQFHTQVSWKLQPAASTPMPTQLDHLGMFAQGDGKYFYGVFVENGRIADVEGVRYRSAFDRIVRELRPGVRLTPMQSILFTDLDKAQVDRLIHILKEHGVKLVEDLSHARRWSMACPALPTCGLALTEAERQLPSLLDSMEQDLKDLGIDDTPLTIRMTGCPNGCARPYNADIGFVGRKPGVYHIFVGGGLAGDRLADLFAADVAVADISKSLRPLLSRFAKERLPDESVSDFYRRVTKRSERRSILTGKESPTGSLVELTISG